GLTQILMVCDEVLRNNQDYTEAVKTVANWLGIGEKSVADKCTRKLGINTERFRELLQHKDELVNFLVDEFPEHEETIRNRLQ
ncbi:MAG: hypothetical protein AB1817_10955, partial [Chloroflexota bacterium]